MRARWAGTIVLTIGGLLLSQPAANAADPLEQIEPPAGDQRGLSPAERKLDSRLAVDLHGRTKAGTTEVDIVTTTPGSVARQPACWPSGANVKVRLAAARSDPRAGADRASSTPSRAGARSSASGARSGRSGRASSPPRTKEQRAARREAAVRAAATVVSQGDATHGADPAAPATRSTASAEGLRALRRHRLARGRAGRG